jgi:hypothetical protein
MEAVFVIKDKTLAAVIKKLWPFDRQVVILYKGLKGVIVDVQIDQKITGFSVIEEDKAGNKIADPAATLAWSLTDPTLGSVAPSADGLSCDVLPSGKLGSCQLQVSVVDGSLSAQGSSDAINFLPGSLAKVEIAPGQVVAQ